VQRPRSKGAPRESPLSEQPPERGRKKKAPRAKEPETEVPFDWGWRATLLAASIAVFLIAASLVAVNVLGERPLPGIGLGGEGCPAGAEGPCLGAAGPVDPGPCRGAGEPGPAVFVSALPPELPPAPAPRTLVFVIDDAGHNLRDLEPFLRFPGPMTIAVLPGLPHSAEAARLIRAAGKEVFLHQPMEAVGGEDPGPGAIYSWMSADEVREVLDRNLAEIGPVAGMNNHMGSKITADERIMEAVLAFGRERGIPFLDSKTTAASAAPALARRMGVAIVERDVFIDNNQDRASMGRAIAEGRGIASRRGSAVMIGHVWSSELAPLLKELYRDLAGQGYEFAAASRLIAR